LTGAADPGAILAGNDRLSCADRAAFAAAEDRLGALWPEIVAQQRIDHAELAELIAMMASRRAHEALCLAAGCDSLDDAVARLTDGTIAYRMTLENFDSTTPDDAACGAGCFFCCVVVDRITVTEAEIAAVHAHLDGAAPATFHPQACPALDDDTRACRAHPVRPLMCRDVHARSVDPCRRSFEDGRLSPDATFEKSGGEMIFLGVNWLLIALERPERLRFFDLKASLHANGTPVPLPPVSPDPA
jgi:Fe-S-cluster containining protein